MAKETHVNDGGTWRKASEIHVKSGGVWRDIQEVHVKDGGVWRQVFSAFSASLSGTFGSIFDVSRTSVQTSSGSVTVNISSGTLTASLSGTGTGLRMSINGGSYLLGDRTVSNGDVIRVRQTSSASYNTTTTCILNLSGYDSETFSVTTEGAP